MLNLRRCDEGVPELQGFEFEGVCLPPKFSRPLTAKLCIRSQNFFEE